jgi:hypothetical protein
MAAITAHQHKPQHSHVSNSTALAHTAQYCSYSTVPRAAKLHSTVLLETADVQRRTVQRRTASNLPELATLQPQQCQHIGKSGSSSTAAAGNSTNAGGAQISQMRMQISSPLGIAMGMITNCNSQYPTPMAAYQTPLGRLSLSVRLPDVPRRRSAGSP